MELVVHSTSLCYFLCKVSNYVPTQMRTVLERRIVYENYRGFSKKWFRSNPPRHVLKQPIGTCDQSSSHDSNYSVSALRTESLSNKNQTL